MSCKPSKPKSLLLMGKFHSSLELQKKGDQNLKTTCGFFFKGVSVTFLTLWTKVHYIDLTVNQ